MHNGFIYVSCKYKTDKGELECSYDASLTVTERPGSSQPTSSRSTASHIQRATISELLPLIVSMPEERLPAARMGQPGNGRVECLSKTGEVGPLRDSSAGSV